MQEKSVALQPRKRAARCLHCAPTLWLGTVHMMLNRHSLPRGKKSGNSDVRGRILFRPDHMHCHFRVSSCLCEEAENPQALPNSAVSID